MSEGARVIAQILATLPHRYPMLLVDRVETLVLGETSDNGKVTCEVSFTAMIGDPGFDVRTRLLRSDFLAPLFTRPTSSTGETGGQ